MTKYSLINISVVGEIITLTTLNANTDRGARRVAKKYLKDHQVDGIVKIGYYRTTDGMQGVIEL